MLICHCHEVFGSIAILNDIRETTNDEGLMTKDI